MRPGFLAATVNGFSRALGHALISEETAREPGLLQSLDPRVRVVGIFALVIAVTLVHKITAVLALFAVGLLLALSSKVSLATLAKRVWLIALAFTGVMALPALFLTPGTRLSGFAGQTLGMTEQGTDTAAMLIARVETAVTLTTVLVLCTPWNHILKALRALHLPKEVVTMLGMAHRYIFLLAETAGQMFESRQSRSVGVLHGAQQRKLVAQTAGVLMSKSIDLSQDVYLAMQSRGYRGDVYTLNEFRMRARDWIVLFVFFAIAVVAVWLGR